jgi:hypothetical protein
MLDSGQHYSEFGKNESWHSDLFWLVEKLIPATPEDDKTLVPFPIRCSERPI